MAFESPFLHDPPGIAPPQPLESQVIRGRAAILSRQPLLAAMCARFGQQGEADNLEHFLTTPAGLRKTPCLVLLVAPPGSEQTRGSVQNTVEGYAGAVLLSEYRMAGAGLKLYATSDWTGRRNVFGPVQQRPQLAATACRALMEQGAHVVFTAYHLPEPVPSEQATVRAVLRGLPAGKGRWSMLDREFPLYLPLLSTFDLTLARIGQRTRSNMRYYRRRVEAQLGCTFIPQVEISLEDFLAFSRVSSFPLPDEASTARYHSMQTVKQPFFSGIRAADGRWLSLVFGWYRHTAIELEWQVNRADLPEHSLGLVMRAYLIEQAIAQGCERLYIEGGTQQAIQQSFVSEAVGDLILMRNSLYARTVARFATRMFNKDTYLRVLLAETDLHWQDW